MKNPTKVEGTQRKPIASLTRLGTLDEVLRSQASPELKAACIDMRKEAAQRRGDPQAGE